MTKTGIDVLAALTKETNPNTPSLVELTSRSELRYFVGAEILREKTDGQEYFYIFVLKDQTDELATNVANAPLEIPVPFKLSLKDMLHLADKIDEIKELYKLEPLEHEPNEEYTHAFLQEYVDTNPEARQYIKQAEFNRPIYTWVLFDNSDGLYYFHMFMVSLKPDGLTESETIKSIKISIDCFRRLAGMMDYLEQRLKAQKEFKSGEHTLH